MSAGRFAEVERLYHEATRRRPEERAAFLDQACGGDEGLRQEVESLLSLPTDAGEFLSRTALEEAARAGHRAWESASWPTIPGYTVRRVLGEGGMGVVYLAEQETPLRRLVALKLIKPGMDTRQVVARFETERQALALMDHPNIAAVFDAGSTEEGRPYFVMEFVDGVAITDYCDRERLSTCDRLDLFVRVCAAVQHAHQKGVIHRDLKPSNVLVTERDGQSLPKVIDFGTAKAVGGASIATTTQGGQGMVLGTLEYMSPEQAALSADIDTATDVYSLGVLLYELLVGRLPFDTDDLRAAGYDEIRRVIRESDPPKPSVRVEQRRDRSGAAARARQTDAPGLTRQLKGDLDWITLKALEKDRKRRYATVAAFATDIGRFLDDQPVDARPPSSTYRIRKFTRRHRGAVAAAVTLFVVLVAGLAASRWQYLRAEDARIEANRQRTEAESERARADSARASAEGATAEANIQKLDAERQRLMATQETQRAVAALDLADYRNYVIAIAAADAEVRASRFSQAREQLLAVPAARRGWEWGHLFLRTENRLLPLADRAPCPFSTDLEGRPVRRIDSLVKNPDGKQIYFTHCNRVNAWNTETLEESVAVPTSGNLIAAAMSSRRIEYSPASNNPKPQPETVRLAWPTDPTKKWNLYLVDSIGSRLPKLIGTVDREPGCAELSRDGRTLALGLRPLYSLSPPYLVETGVFESDVFEVWDVENGRRISQVRDPKPPSPDSRLSDRCFVRFSPDMTLLATSGAVVRVWVAATGVPVHVDPGLAGNNPQPIAFSPTTRQLAIGRRNGLIDVLDFVDSSWTINSLDGANILRPQPINERNRFAEVNARRHEEVVAIAFTSDGQAIVSALATAVIVWDLQSARVRRVLDTPQSSVTGLVVHEQLVYSSHADATVKVVELQALSGITKLESSTPVSEPYFRMSADGSTVAVGSTFGSLTVWNLDDRREVLAGHDNGLPIYVVAALADKRTILTRPKLPTWGTSIRWDYETRQSTSLPTLYRTEPGCGTEGPYGAAASPNDRYLAMHLGSCVVIRDLASARTLAVLPVNKPGPAVSLDMGVRFLSDESLLVSTLDGRTLQAHPTRAEEVVSIMRWNWTSKRLSAERSFPIRDRNGAMTDFLIAPSADGHRIAISSLGFATIWDGTLTHPIGRVPTPPNARVALSADGERLAVCARDQNSILVWDTATAQLLLTLTDDDVPKFLAFTPSGQLIAGNSSGGLTIWETQRPKCAQCPKAPVSAK